MAKLPNQATPTRESARAGESHGARNTGKPKSESTAPVPHQGSSQATRGRYELRFVNQAFPYKPKKRFRVHPRQPRPPLPADAAQRAAEYGREWDQMMAIQRERIAELDHPVFRSWTLGGMRTFLRTRRRNKDSTIEHTIRQLGLMSKHPIAPVRLHDGPVELARSANIYLFVRETVEGTNPTSLRDDYFAIRNLARMLQLPPDIIPRLPPIPPPDKRWIPSPEEVYDLLHAEYCERPNINYENALTKALLIPSFPLGLRTPSEPFEMKLTDHDADRHTLVVTEPKKGDRRRSLELEPHWVCCSTRHPSLQKYSDYWRVKVDPDEKQTDFFLRPDGHPFSSKTAMSDFVATRVKRQFPWFTSYLGRHWTASARLIEWDYDYVRVANWLGHGSLDMLRETYDNNTRFYQRIYGDDWLSRIARRPSQAVSSTQTTLQ